MLNDDVLHRVMPRMNEADRSRYVPLLQAACAEFAIDSPRRAAAFLAQLAHESGELRWWREIWGPTEAQRGYEPPSPKAAELGNLHPGDGFRYRGRGPIQLTGRSNYRRYGATLGLDLERQPDLVATGAVGFRVAACFWATSGLNALADRETREAFRLITRRINGGLNGLSDRERYHEIARRALGLGPLTDEGEQTT